MKKIYSILTMAVMVCTMTVSLATSAHANKYIFTFSDSWESTSAGWLGNSDFDIFITVDNGGTTPVGTFYLDDIQRYTLTSGSYTQVWDSAAGGTLYYDVVDLWKITYDGAAATWSLGDVSSGPPLGTYYTATFNGATDTAGGSASDAGFYTGLYNILYPEYSGLDNFLDTTDSQTNAVHFMHSNTPMGPRSSDPVHVSGALAPEPVSSTLFLIGAATMGYRRFRMRKQ